MSPVFPVPESIIAWLLALFAIPSVGLPAVFIVCVISATLLPMGSEPALYAYIHLSPHMFWPAILVATAGNTLGGMVSYFLGRGAWDLSATWRRRDAAEGNIRPDPPRRHGRWHRKAGEWLERLGPRAMLLSWLPVIGDPLCAVAGWMRFPFWRSVFYMAVGKFARYVMMTLVLMWGVPKASEAIAAAGVSLVATVLGGGV